MFCQWETQPDGSIKCPACGATRPAGRPAPQRRCPAVSRGLGDTIAKITKAVGIKPCKGCKKRQKWLNEKFPYKKAQNHGH